MGLSQYGFALLLARQRMAAGLGRVLTLGRQRAAMGYGNAAALAKQSGVSWHEAKLQLMSPWGDSAILAAGADSIESMDHSSYESCSIVHDLNRPVQGDLRGAFDTVFDGGTLEHVYDFPTAIRNCIDMLKIGGFFIAETPSNNWMGHGFYQFSPELFYRVFCDINGCQLRALALIREGFVDHIHVVDDPATVGSRVRFNLRGTTSLLVMAQKLDSRSGIDQTPQQSDYQTMWRTASNEQIAKLSKARLTFLPHGLLRGLDNLRTDFERWKNRHRGLRRLHGIRQLVEHFSKS